jgi:hypothetical protein
MQAICWFVIEFYYECYKILLSCASNVNAHVNVYNE